MAFLASGSQRFSRAVSGIAHSRSEATTAAPDCYGTRQWACRKRRPRNTTCHLYREPKRKSVKKQGGRWRKQISLAVETCSCQVKHPTEDLSSRPEQSLTNPGQSITVSPRGYSRRRHLEDVLVIGELNSA